jgi:hypothetical protein
MAHRRLERLLVALVAAAALAGCGIIVTTEPVPTVPTSRGRAFSTETTPSTLVPTSTTTSTTNPPGVTGVPVTTLAPRTFDLRSRTVAPIDVVYTPVCELASLIGNLLNGFANGPMPQFSYAAQLVLEDLRAIDGLVPSNRQASYQELTRTIEDIVNEVRAAPDEKAAYQVLTSRHGDLPTSAAARDLTQWVDQVCRPIDDGG